MHQMFLLGKEKTSKVLGRCASMGQRNGWGMSTCSSSPFPPPWRTLDAHTHLRTPGCEEKRLQPLYRSAGPHSVIPHSKTVPPTGGWRLCPEADVSSARRLHLWLAAPTRTTHVDGSFDQRQAHSCKREFAPATKPMATRPQVPPSADPVVPDDVEHDEGECVDGKVHGHVGE